MKAAIIGASKEALHTIEKAHGYGIKIVALDGDPHAPGLGEADRSMTVDISDEGAVIEALRGEKPDFVLTVPIGRYLTTIGAVNDALGLPGITRQMAVLCTDKFRFHQKLNRAGLRSCRCYEVSGGRILDGEGAACFGERAKEAPVSFPAILKPRFGSGSRGVYMLPDRQQLKEALAGISGEAYVLEECIAGEEYGVDGAVTKDGFHMVLLRRKKNTPPPVRQAVGYFSVLLQEDFYKQVREYMEKAVACLGLGECLVHGDIIRGEAGPFLIELSARPSGHHLHDLFTPLCTGIDLAEEYMKYRMGLSYRFAPGKVRSMMIHYFDIQGRVGRAPGREQAEQAAGVRFAAWECHIKKGEELKPVSDGHSLMGRGYFVLEGEDRLWLEEKAGTVRGLFF